MIAQIKATYRNYPGQFWLMFVGLFISIMGASMIWPFLMIFVSRKLNTSMTVTASLLTIQSACGLAASIFGGPLLDRLGRKGIMVFSLFTNGLAYVFFAYAQSFSHFAILMALTGAVNPLYRAAADTMLADLLPAERRADGYSLMRLSNNLAISIGPAVGGTLVTRSYALGFYCAALGMIAYSLLLAWRARETIPARPADLPPAPHEPLGGYPVILRDAAFMRFVLAFTLVSIPTVLMWTLMPVHANLNYSVPEARYGYIPMTNAMMVVSLQTWVTNRAKRRPPLAMLALGGLIYALAAGGVSLAYGFTGFWLCMVVMTVGEMILAPISSTYAANLAPVDKRGRYLGLVGLTWPVASGVGPLFGGLLSDTYGPQSTWLGGMVVGLVGTGIFVWLYTAHRRTALAVVQIASEEPYENRPAE